MSTTLTITPGQVTASIDLRRTTALMLCTHVVRTAGQVQVVRDWPRLSSGEELLWTVLAWLSGEVALPDRETLRAGLDVANYTAVAAVLDAERVAS